MISLKEQAVLQLEVRGLDSLCGRSGFGGSLCVAMQVEAN